MCSSQPDCLDVVWNICVVPSPEEDRQGRDRGWGMGEGRSGGTPGLLRKKPSVFPSLLSPPPQCGVTSERSQGTAWGRCKMWVCGRGREREKKNGEKARQGQSDCVVNCQVWLMTDDWWSWRLGFLQFTELLAGLGRGAMRGALVQTCGWLPHQQQHHSPAPCLYVCGAYLRACLTMARSLWWTDTRWQQPKCLAL